MRNNAYRLPEEKPDSGPQPVQVWLYPRHKMRMELARTLITLDHPERSPPNQSEVIQWLLDTCPIPELLRARMQAEPDIIPEGVIDAEFTTRKALDAAGDTAGLDPAAVERAGAAAFGAGEVAGSMESGPADVPHKSRVDRRRRAGARNKGKRRKRPNDGAGERKVAAD